MSQAIKITINKGVIKQQAELGAREEIELAGDELDCNEYNKLVADYTQQLTSEMEALGYTVRA